MWVTKWSEHAFIYTNPCSIINPQPKHSVELVHSSFSHFIFIAYHRSLTTFQITNHLQFYFHFSKINFSQILISYTSDTFKRMSISCHWWISNSYVSAITIKKVIHNIKFLVNFNNYFHLSVTKSVQDAFNHTNHSSMINPQPKHSMELVHSSFSHFNFIRYHPS